MRYLAIDIGDKRTGLALGSDETQVVAPMEVIEQPRGPRLIDALLKSVEEYAPKALVVGLPMNMDGSEGPQAKSTREFAGKLGQRSGLPVHYQDERLTSFAAEEQLKQSGRTHGEKKELRDALAAAEILRDFLDARRTGEP